MLKYSKYLISSIVRKKAPYFIVLILFLIFDSSTYLQVKQLNESFAPKLNTMSTFDKFFPFLFAAFFTAMIVIYVFKQGESDGSELMVVAKPISRTQIVFGKFLVIFLYLFSYTLITFFNYYALSFVDKFITNKDRIQYALSLSIGGAIVLLIVASIIIIFASFLNKTGLLALGVVAASIIPIISFILSPVLKGQAFGYTFLDQYRQNVKIDELGKVLDKATNQAGKIDKFDGQNIQTIIDPHAFYINESESQNTSFTQYESEVKYNNAAPIDLWYQWGRLYSLFQKKNKTNIALAKWERKVKTIEANQEMTMTIDGDEYVFSVNLLSLSNIQKIIPFLGDMFIELNKNAVTWNALSLFDRLYTVSIWTDLLRKRNYVNKSLNISSKDFVQSTDKNFEQRLDISSEAVITYLTLEHIAAKSQLNILTTPQKAYPTFVNINSSTDGVQYYTLGSNAKEEILPVSRFSKVGSNIYIFSPKEFIQSDYILIIWGIFAVGFLSLALVLFLRRDFR